MHYCHGTLHPSILHNKEKYWQQNEYNCKRALVKPQPKIGLERANTDNIITIIGVTGCAPLNFLSQFSGNGYIPKLSHLILPVLGSVDV